MPRIEKRFLNGVGINNSDTSGSDKFQDITLPAGVEVDVGEFTVPTDSLGATWGGDKMFAVLFDDTTTAVREEGFWRFYTQNTEGQRHKTFEARSEVVGAASQVSTPSEHNFMPMGDMRRLAPPGGKLVVTFESDATATTDSTDHTITQLPIAIVRR